MIGCRREGDIAPRDEWRRQRGTGQDRAGDPEADPERGPRTTTTHLGLCSQKVWSRRNKV
jgi:hypothetical protein